MSEKFWSVDEHVMKTGGDYHFEGVVVARFAKVSGQIRYVVENRDGLLFIFNGNQLEKA